MYGQCCQVSPPESLLTCQALLSWQDGVDHVGHLVPDQEKDVRPGQDSLKPKNLLVFALRFVKRQKENSDRLSQNRPTLTTCPARRSSNGAYYLWDRKLEVFVHRIEAEPALSSGLQQTGATSLAHSAGLGTTSSLIPWCAAIGWATSRA